MRKILYLIVMICLMILAGCKTKCVNTCAAEANVKCALDGYYVCGYFNNDTCLEWSSVRQCPAGQSCVGGSCTSSCQNECIANQKQCLSGTTYRICGNFDLDNCTEWGNALSCPSGQSCASGECTTSCTNDCASGAKVCSGSGYKTCGNYDPDSCLEWSAVVACPLNQSCSNGLCSATCQSECSSGGRQCAGNYSLRYCGNYDSDICLEWGNETSCPANRTCSGGQCVSCSDRCTANTTECVGNNTYRRCGSYDADSCVEWGTTVACNSTASCYNGTCRLFGNCASACVAGTRACNLNAYHECADFDNNGCAEWSSYVQCSAGMLCVNGSCYENCTSDCTLGLKQCSGNGFKTCGNYDSDSCAEWSNISACATGTNCTNGTCIAPSVCTNNCTLGMRQCSGSGYQQCGDHDGDSCTEWGNVTSCPVNQSCALGLCIPSPVCTNNCTLGLRQCSGNGYQQCGDYNGDSCTEWGNVTSCTANQSCSLGLCVANCSNECTLLERQCSGTGYKTCGYHDTDACTEWSNVTQCETGKSCSAGNCVTIVQCNDICNTSSRQCSGNGYQTCGDYNGDTCAEWGTVTACTQPGSTCVMGSCTGGCTDDCVLGQKQCSGAGFTTCGNYDADACYEMGNLTSCASGQTCSNGICSATCTNDCSPGQRTCFTGGYLTCGNVDPDPCYDWNLSVTSCHSNETCQAGQCVSSCPLACASGSKQCVDSDSYILCADHNSDGCAEWSNSVDCSAGYRCENGSCILIPIGVDECIGGSVRCNGDGNETCADYDADSFMEWGNWQGCPYGSTCSDGKCSGSCTEECTAGQTQCALGGVETCVNIDSDPCMEWSIAAPCPQGQSCSQGACVGGCTDECQEDYSSCVDSGTMTFCVDYDEDPCLDLYTMDCMSGYACQGDQCVVTDCSLIYGRCTVSGDKRCNYGDYLEICGIDPDSGCLEWGDAKECAPGYECSGTDCALMQCTDECETEGDILRDSHTAFECGNFDEDPCLEWQEIECKEGSHYNDRGYCVSCTDECSPLSTICEGEGFYSCADHDQDGCLEYTDDDGSYYTPCPEGCVNGRCNTGCIDICTPGESVCVWNDVNDARVCGNYDSDSCNEYKFNDELCPQDYHCRDGVCIPYPCTGFTGYQCDDLHCEGECDDFGEYDLGIVPFGYYTCGDDEENEYFSMPTVGTIEYHECTAYETILVKACPNATELIDLEHCDYPCSLTQTRCRTQTPYISITDFNATTANIYYGFANESVTIRIYRATSPGGSYDEIYSVNVQSPMTFVRGSYLDHGLSPGTFYYYKATAQVPGAEASDMTEFLSVETWCLDGECKGCSNECTLNDKKCYSEYSGAQSIMYESCGDFDSDGCTEWKKIHCPVGQACVGGQCSADACITDIYNTCYEETSSCYTMPKTSVYTCGQFDADPCLDRHSQDCPAGVGCAGSVCGTCKDECDFQTDICIGDHFVACEDLDDDGCKELRTSSSCGSSKVCNSSSSCGCLNECPSLNYVYCMGDTDDYYLCTDYDHDGCLEWHGYYWTWTAAGLGLTCSNVQTITNQYDQCMAGDTICHDDAMYECVYDDHTWDYLGLFPADPQSNHLGGYRFVKNYECPDSSKCDNTLGACKVGPYIPEIDVDDFNGTAITLQLRQYFTADRIRFNIYRSTSLYGPFQKIATTSLNQYYYHDHAISPDTTYYYKVTAEIEGALESDMSTVVAYTVY